MISPDALATQRISVLDLNVCPLFSKPVWESAIVLLVGAILAPGKRTVSAILRVMGLHHEPHFQNYHRVLSRAVWSSRHASQLLLQQLVNVFASSGVLVMGLDDTIELFNNTLRQRVGRLVRKTLSFSKKLGNHVGAIWYFVHHYNALLRS